EAGADDHAEPFAVTGGTIEVPILNSHSGRGHGVVNEGVGLLDLFLLDPILGVETGDLARDPAGVCACVELGDRADAGAAFDEALPRRLIADAERGDHPESGDDDAALVHESCDLRTRKVGEIDPAGGTGARARA